MKKIWTIAIREYNAAVRTKAFLISLLLLPVMMGGGVAVSEFSQKYGADIATKKVAVIDRTPGEQLFDPLKDAADRRNETTIYESGTHRQILARFDLVRVPPSAADDESIAKQRYDLAEQTRRGEIFAFLEIQPGVLGVSTTTTNNASIAPRSNRLAATRSGALSSTRDASHPAITPSSAEPSAASDNNTSTAKASSSIPKSLPPSGPLAPVRGGEGQGERPNPASATDSGTPTPLTPALSPEYKGKGGATTVNKRDNESPDLSKSDRTAREVRDGSSSAARFSPLVSNSQTVSKTETSGLKPAAQENSPESTSEPSSQESAVADATASTIFAAGDGNDGASVFYSSNTPTYTSIQQWAQTAIGRAVTQRKIETLGIPRETARSLLTQTPVVPQSLARKDASGKIVLEPPPNLGVTLIRPVATIMLMFVIVLVGSSPMSMNIMEEKQQKIAEVMLGSVRPFELMMGKLLGGVGVALTLIAIYFGVAGYGASKFGFGQYVSWDLIGWFVVFSVVAVFLYGSMFLAVGAAVNNAREAQSLITPVMMLVVLPILMLTPMLQAPSGTLAMIFSFFPLSAPMIAMARLTIPPGIPMWQPVLSLILAVLAAVVVIWAAGRIFRVGLLLQGKAPRLKDLAQWVIRG